MDPPVPIPNTEVKRLNADDTALVVGWDNMKSPGFKKGSLKNREPFLIIKLIQTSSSRHQGNLLFRHIDFTKRFLQVLGQANLKLYLFSTYRQLKSQPVGMQKLPAENL